MSVLAVRDLVLGDLLTELNLKPSWEKIRGYGFAAGAVSALFMTYLMQSSINVDCIPMVTENITTDCIPMDAKSAFSTTEARFANTYCLNELPWYVSICGNGPLCYSIIILLAASAWTLISDVINSFRAFAKFEEIIGKSNLTPDQLCDMSSNVLDLKSSDEQRQVRKACFLLWKYESSHSVEWYYRRRNSNLIFAILAYFPVWVVSLIFLHKDKNNFECYLDLGNEFEETVKGIKRQLCSHNGTNMLLPLMLTFTISLIVQVVATAVGIKKCWPRNKNYESTANDVSDFDKKMIFDGYLSSKGKFAAEYSYFMVNFWKNSKLTDCRILKQLVHYIFRRGIDRMKLNLEAAISKDVEMVVLYHTLRQNGDKDIFDAINREVRKKSFIPVGKHHDNVVRCLLFLRPKLSWKHLCGFITHLHERKFWELLACVLAADADDWLYSTEFAPRMLAGIKIDINEIGKPYDLGRSILYYFTSENLRAARGGQFILRKNEDKYYVHFDGKSMPIKKFINDIPLPSKSYPVGNCFVDEIFESGSRKMIEDFHRKHVLKTDQYKEKFTMPNEETNEETIKNDYAQYLEDSAKKISRYKFDEWEKNIKDLAEFANSEKQWVLLVALLNAFFVNKTKAREHDRERDNPCNIKSCGVNEFAMISQNISPPASFSQNISPPASLLFYALRKPPYLKKFQFTAIDYILDCTVGQEKIVRKKDGTIVSAIDYVTENEDLEFDEREQLLGMLEDSMQLDEELHAGTSHATSGTLATTERQQTDNDSPGPSQDTAMHYTTPESQITIDDDETRPLLEFKSHKV